MKSAQQKSLFLIGLGFLVPMLAARLTRQVAVKSYKLIKHEEAPENPGNPEVNWSDALVFAAVTGLFAGLARMTALRLLSSTMIPAEGDDMEEEIEDIDLV